MEMIERMYDNNIEGALILKVIVQRPGYALIQEKYLHLNITFERHYIKRLVFVD